MTVHFHWTEVVMELSRMCKIVLTESASRLMQLAQQANLVGSAGRSYCTDSDRDRPPIVCTRSIGVELNESLYALDSTTIDLCLSLFPWAKFRRHKAAVKMHTLLDLHGNIPSFIHITDGKTADVNILDQLIPEAGAFYVMDRGYLDFARLFVFTLCSAFFIIRAVRITP